MVNVGIKLLFIKAIEYLSFVAYNNGVAGGSGDGVSKPTHKVLTYKNTPHAGMVFMSNKNKKTPEPFGSGGLRIMCAESAYRISTQFLMIVSNLLAVKF